MSSIIIPKLPKTIRDWEAHHASRKTDVVNDDVVMMMANDDFLGEIESEGIRRKVMADLGFNMESDAEEPERIKIDLGKGYATFNPYKRVVDQDGEHLGGYEIRKGKGLGSIIIQGDKNGVA